MHALRRWIATGLLAVLQAGAWAQGAPTPATGAASGAASSGAIARPAVMIECLLVRDRPLHEKLWVAQAAAAPVLATGLAATSQHAGCIGGSSTGLDAVLVGTGDLELVIPQATYQRAVKYEEQQSSPMLLYVNGVAMPKDALLVGIENLDDGTHLRYRIKHGEESQKLWAALYRDKGLLGQDTLRPALGWAKDGPASTLAAKLLTADNAAARLAITSPLQVGFATAVVALLLAGLVYLGARTDALRDAPLPAGLEKPVRASFSLSRVQMAMWFAFAIAAGVFLWIVYGELRSIDGSLLSLLGISVVNGAVSLGVDRNAGGRAYAPSQGLFLDLVTGFDDAHQVHRYQAVAVNLLLLFVGISHVLQQLAYPIFAPTWLALLGISGAALALGKQQIENPGAAAAAGQIQNH